MCSVVWCPNDEWSGEFTLHQICVCNHVCDSFKAYHFVNEFRNKIARQSKTDRPPRTTHTQTDRQRDGRTSTGRTSVTLNQALFSSAQ